MMWHWIPPTSANYRWIKQCLTDAVSCLNKDVKIRLFIHHSNWLHVLGKWQLRLASLSHPHIRLPSNENDYILLDVGKCWCLCLVSYPAELCLTLGSEKQALHKSTKLLRAYVAVQTEAYFRNHKTIVEVNLCLKYTKYRTKEKLYMTFTSVYMVNI